MALLDQYLELNGTTRYKVAQDNGIRSSMLQRAAAHTEVDSISARVFIYVGNTIDKTPGTVLDEMLRLSQAAEA